MGCMTQEAFITYSYKNCVYDHQINICKICNKMIIFNSNTPIYKSNYYEITYKSNTYKIYLLRHNISYYTAFL